MRNLALAIFTSVVLMVAGAAAQSCPTVTVSSPGTVKRNEPITMTAKVIGGDPNVTPTYNWTVSSGMIAGGQGTSTITVDTVDAQTTVTGTVDVGGYGWGCRTFNSSLTTVAGIASRKDGVIDSATRYPDQKIANLARHLTEYASARAVMIFYTGRKSPEVAIEAQVGLARKMLIEDEKVPAGSIEIVKGGTRDQAVIELWIVPEGAEPPVASPPLVSSGIQKPPAKRLPKGCPTLTLTGPTEDTAPGAMMIFSSTLGGVVPKIKPTYRWTVSGGKIGMGQGTDWIVVDTTGASMLITATVEVGGFGRACRVTKSLTGFMGPVKNPKTN